MKKIQCPTLLFYATNEGKMSLFWNQDIEKMMKERMQCIRDHRLVQVNGNHHVHLDYPDRVLSHISDFLFKAPQSKL